MFIEDRCEGVNVMSANCSSRASQRCAIVFPNSSLVPEAGGVRAVNQLFPVCAPVLARDDEPCLILGDRRRQNLRCGAAVEAWDEVGELACDEGLSTLVPTHDISHRALKTLRRNV